MRNRRPWGPYSHQLSRQGLDIFAEGVSEMCRPGKGFSMLAVLAKNTVRIGKGGCSSDKGTGK